MRRLRPILRALTPAGWAVLVLVLASVAFAVISPVLAVVLVGFGAFLILT